MKREPPAGNETELAEGAVDVILSVNAGDPWDAVVIF